MTAPQIVVGIACAAMAVAAIGIVFSKDGSRAGRACFFVMILAFAVGQVAALWNGGIVE